MGNNEVWIRPGVVLSTKNDKATIESFGALFEDVPVLFPATGQSSFLALPLEVKEQGLLLKVYGSKTPVFLRGVFSKQTRPASFEAVKIQYKNAVIVLSEENIELRASAIALESESVKLKTQDLEIDASLSPKSVSKFFNNAQTVDGKRIVPS